LDKQLEGQDYICGEYSIADMACWPWASRYEWHKVDITKFPIQKGYHVPKVMGEIPTA